MARTSANRPAPTPPVLSRSTASEELDPDSKGGFSLDIESDVAPKGLSEDVVRLISSKKQEPEWMLEWRLKAYRHWLNLETDYQLTKALLRRRQQSR